ncbi:Aldo/keto reductase [Wilcoxina mikolae CBS 423.85]|nr:Aldo/keto reductase [Wilcoxina mikolae CBS 423.85]
MTTLTLPSTLRPHPLLLYGTAWKKSSTTTLVSLALSHGFQGLDTACQPKHYREDLVGLAIPSSVRPNLFIQTKFTPPSGQDPANTPYKFSLPLEDQVRTSVAKSLENLNTTYLDAVLLHSPLKTAKETVTAWKVLQEFVVDGTVRHLGISNVTVKQLEELYSHHEVTIKPAIVQNRFYGETGYDRDVREFCKTHGMVWQSFWTLTGNPGLLRSAVVGRVAEKVVVGREEALYLLVLALGRGWESGGVCVLDGTTREEGMKGDLEAVGKVGLVEEGDLEEFGRLIGDLK